MCLFQLTFENQMLSILKVSVNINVNFNIANKLLLKKQYLRKVPHILATMIINCKV